MDPNETKYNIILFYWICCVRIEFYEHGHGHETGVPSWAYNSLSIKLLITICLWIYFSAEIFIKYKYTWSLYF